ncbi:unnamed protein product [Oikopleura dioica]|uniref:Uncharacterized protein n=1 Tax=Oikopleura dioica TaxID=34765 RepID=E4XZ49_OIKDI|nr:unnamed protein product [Oikopleura dioica]
MEDLTLKPQKLTVPSHSFSGKQVKITKVHFSEVGVPMVEKLRTRSRKPTFLQKGREWPGYTCDSTHIQNTIHQFTALHK